MLDRPSQLKVEDSGISAGIYAPTIRYNPHNDTFYMITTQFSGGMGKHDCENQRPDERLERPCQIKFEGIDPDIFLMTTERPTLLTTMHPKSHYTKDTE